MSYDGQVWATDNHPFGLIEISIGGPKPRHVLEEVIQQLVKVYLGTTSERYFDETRGNAISNK
jgi:hypothetical protein